MKGFVEKFRKIKIRRRHVKKAAWILFMGIAAFSMIASSIAPVFAQ